MTRGRPAWTAAALAFAAAAGACTARDTVATSGRTDDTLPGYCAGDGPPVLVDDRCTGELAETLFRHAVCGCGGLSFNGDLVTDGFDSRTGPYAPGSGGGHVASNVGLNSNASMTIAGDVTVGDDGLGAGPILLVDGDLTSGGLLGRPTSTIEVDGSARIAGPVEVASLSVGGTLITPSGAATPIGEIDAPQRTTADVTVPPPCRCDEAPDVAEVIAEHRLVNHDAELPMAADALVGVDGDENLEVPCGRFYLDEISGNSEGTVAIEVIGRAALFVGGSVTLQQGLTIELAENAELDLFIAGNIQVTGIARLGNEERPRALRVYVASGGAISLAPGSTLAGNLYAPLADLNTIEPFDLEVFGALVVNHINNGAAPVTIHRDIAVAAAADGCVD